MLDLAVLRVLILREMPLPVHIVPIYLHSSACRRQWWRYWREGLCRLSAFCTVLSFLALLTVSGPHLVHHLLEQPPQHNEHHSHAGQAQQWPDCLVLFLIQHTPVAEECAAPLPALLLVVEPLAYVQPLWVWAVPQHIFQARAPPAALL
jgi:hypothetical protein